MSELAGFREVIATSSPANLVGVLNLLSEADIKIILDHLDRATLQDVLLELDPAVQSVVLQKVSLADLRAILGQLSPAYFTKLYEEVDPSLLKAFAERISTPDELRQIIDLVEGDDDMIELFLEKAGVEATLDRIFTIMPSRVLPGHLDGESGVIEWRVDTDGGERVYQLSISGDTAEMIPGPAKAPRTTVSVGAADMVRLSCGLLDGVTAFMTGQIQVDGDILFGAQLSVLFDLGR